MNNIEALKGYLQCPICNSENFSFKNDSIDCNQCYMSYRITNNIPEIILPEVEKSIRKVQKTFEFKWEISTKENVIQNSYIFNKKYEKTIIPVTMQAKNNNWIELTKKEFDINEKDIDNKTVLDIGAGFGRMAYVMGTMGAKHIYSFDICRSGMENALKELDDWKNITFLQADIANMPFKNESFDIVISWGVFHHTPNTEESFRKGAKLVKPGGLLLVHLYENSDLTRLKYTNNLRAFIQKFPLGIQYWFCKKFLTVYDWSVFSRPDMKGDIMRFFHKKIMFGNNPLGTFDCYSPRFNHTHTDEEVISWYKSEGFDEVQVINNELYDPNLSREDNEFLQKDNGKHGGFLLVKGKKSLQ